MKHKRYRSIGIITLSVVLTLIIGALTYTLLNSIAPRSNTSTDEKSISQLNATQDPNMRYTELKDWKVRFASDVAYSVKLNSNKSAYFISIQELAASCSTPDTPWIGIIQRFSNPREKQTVGPDAGKTMNQIFGNKGTTIDGKLYYFDTATQFCTRDTSIPEVEQAAKQLAFDIKSLESY